MPIGNNTLVNPLQSTTITVLPYSITQQQQLPNAPLSNTSSATVIKIDKNKRVERRSNSFDNNNNHYTINNTMRTSNSNFSSMNYLTKFNKKTTLHDLESSGEFINRKCKESHRYLSLDRVVHQSSGKYIKNTYETSSNGLSNNYNNLTNQNLSPNTSTKNINSDINLSNNNDNSINGDILCEIMKHSFLDLHNNMIENSSETCSLEMSGCTATSIMIEGNVLISSNVGDSRGLLCRRNNENKYFGIQITTDHRVSMPV